MDNSQQIDLAAEFVRTMIPDGITQQERERIYAQIDCAKNELKTLNALMNGRIDFAIIYKALSEMSL